MLIMPQPLLIDIVLKGCSHNVIVTAIYFSQLMGYMGYISYHVTYPMMHLMLPTPWWTDRPL